MRKMWDARRIFEPSLSKKSIMEQQDAEEWARKFLVFTETVGEDQSLSDFIDKANPEFPLSAEANPALFDQFKLLFACRTGTKGEIYRDPNSIAYNAFAPLLSSAAFQKSVLLQIQRNQTEGVDKRVYLTQACLDSVKDKSEHSWEACLQSAPVQQGQAQSPPVAPVVRENVPDVVRKNVPDVLFEPIPEHQGKKIFIQSAAHQSTEGGAFDRRGNVQEESLYQNSDAPLGISGKDSDTRTRYPGRLRSIGGVYLHKDLTAFQKDGPVPQATDDPFPLQQYTQETNQFNIIQAAALDFRNGERTSFGETDDVLSYAMSPEGQKACFQLNYSNYYHTLQLAHENSDGEGYVYLTALGCNAFRNPDFIVAAAARLAIDQFRADYSDSNLAIQFTLGAQMPADAPTLQTFKHYMKCPTDEVHRDLNPQSKAYQDQMIEFFKRTPISGQPPSKLWYEQDHNDQDNKYDAEYNPQPYIYGVQYLKCLDQKISRYNESLPLLRDRYLLPLTSNLIAPLCVAGFVALMITGYAPLVVSNVAAIGVMLAILALGTWGASGLKQLYYSGQDNMKKAFRRSAMILMAVSLGTAIFMANMPMSFAKMLSTSAVLLKNFSVLNITLPLMGSGLLSSIMISGLMIVPFCFLMIRLYRSHRICKDLNKISLSRLIRLVSVMGLFLGSSALIVMAVNGMSLPLVAVSLGSLILCLIEGIKSLSGMGLEKTFLLNIQGNPHAELEAHLEKQPILARYFYDTHKMFDDNDTSDVLKDWIKKSSREDASHVSSDQLQSGDVAGRNSAAQGPAASLTASSQAVDRRTIGSAAAHILNEGEDTSGLEAPLLGADRGSSEPTEQERSTPGAGRARADSALKMRLESSPTRAQQAASPQLKQSAEGSPAPRSQSPSPGGLAGSE